MTHANDTKNGSTSTGTCNMGNYITHNNTQAMVRMLQQQVQNLMFEKESIDDKSTLNLTLVCEPLWIYIWKESETIDNFWAW